MQLWVSGASWARHVTIGLTLVSNTSPGRPAKACKLLLRFCRLLTYDNTARVWNNSVGLESPM